MFPGMSTFWRRQDWLAPRSQHLCILVNWALILGVHWDRPGSKGERQWRLREVDRSPPAKDRPSGLPAM